MTDEQTDESRIPGIEELLACPDDEIDRVLSDAARAMQSGAAPELERLATGDEIRLARAAARALGLVRDVAAADALARIQEFSQDKSVRKEAGRSLHKLRSVGVQPTAKPTDEERFVAPKPANRVERAFASRYDAWGGRFLVTAVRPAGGRLLRMAWVLNESAGIKESNAIPVSKRLFGEWAEELLRDREDVVEIDTEHARFLMNEATEITRRSGGGLPEEYMIYRDAVKGMQKAPTHPIIYDKMDPEEIARDVAALNASGRLLDLQECRWRLEPDRMAPYREKACALFDSVIITSEIVREERLDRLIDEVIAAEFSPDVAGRYRRRLEETAYLLLLKGQEKRARSAFAAALALAGDKAPREIPFVVELATRSIGLVPEGTPEARELARREAEEERASLVKPIFKSRTIEGMAEEIHEGHAREGS